MAHEYQGKVPRQTPETTDTKKPSPKNYAVPSETVRIANDLNHQTYFISGVQVHFPFKPYPSQLAMMNHMIRALSQSKNTMIESPTGSGKSLALLCAALAWQRDFSAKNKKRMVTIRQIIRKYVVGGSYIPGLPGDNKVAKEGAGSTDIPAQIKSETKPDIKPDLGSDPNTVAAQPGDGSGIKLDSDAKIGPGFLKENLENMADIFAYKPMEGGRADNGATKDAKGPDAGSDSDFVPKKGSTDKPAAGDSQQTSATADKKQPNKDVYIEAQVAMAWIKLNGTVDYILQSSKISIPSGLTQKDIDVLQEFKDSNYAQNTPRIYFGSRTHKQVSQLVDELRKKSAYRMQTAVLGSRAQTCINASALNSGAVDEECRNMVDEDKCGPYKVYHRLSSHSKLRAGGSMEIWDIEDVVKLGKSTFACPYFAARDLAATADLVFCPYNYILDPGVREASGIDLQDNIVILDEGHNVENAARDAGSVEITDNQLGVLVNECQLLSRDGQLPSAHQFVGTFAEGLANWLQDDSDEYDYHDYDSQTAVWPKTNASVQSLFERLMMTPAFIGRLELVYAELEDFIKLQRQDKDTISPFDMLSTQKGAAEPSIDDGDDEFVARKKHSNLSPGSMRVLGGLLRVLKHMASPSSPFYNDYRIAKIRRKQAGFEDAASHRKRKRKSLVAQGVPEYINTLAFWALNPGIIFSEISSLTRSVVLTSGTLSPLTSYAVELQMAFSSTLEANHVIDPARFSAIAIECGPSGTLLEAKYQTVNMLEFQDDIGRAICGIAASCPDGMLVFAPSYGLLNKLSARWRTTGLMDTLTSHKDVFFEPQGGPKDQFEKLLKSYREKLVKDRIPGKPLSRGSIMFAVYRGKVSEGIDFSDYFCRTVVNIGIPYPAFKDVKVTLKREYNDSRASMQYRHQLDTSDTNMLNGSLWYEIQAFRAINQALGRCLRHKNDWGAVIMLESRFAHHWNIAKLSKWIRNYMKTYNNFQDAMSELDLFYKTRIAEDEASVLSTDLSVGSTAVGTPVREPDAKMAESDAMETSERSF
ncbi:hypothetical protein GGF39_003091 [Coemansia sp. RSA 1721]|nr:hypothetical protein GGF39_003091 [Coemansia sp. RSA 1721]